MTTLSGCRVPLKRMKNYPYARNYYSIAVILVTFFVAIVPFALFPYATDLGEAAGIGHWTAWLNVPFSAVVGWLFRFAGEGRRELLQSVRGRAPTTSRSPSIARRIEIEMRTMLGEESDLKPIEAKRNILF